MSAKISDKYLQLAAQAWCEPESSSVEMDARLATAFARLLQRANVSGQESMRERCAAFLDDPMRVDRALNDWKPDEMKAPYLAIAIRSLPVEE